MIQKRCLGYQHICKYAAKAGNLKLLKYVRKKGCPWNEWTSFAAARAGNLGVIKYLRENGCPFHKRNYQVAHNPAVQRYISENGYSDYLQLCLGRSSDDSKPINVSFDYYEYY